MEQHINLIRHTYRPFRTDWNSKANSFLFAVYCKKVNMRSEPFEFQLLFSGIYTHIYLDVLNRIEYVIHHLWFGSVWVICILGQV